MMFPIKWLRPPRHVLTVFLIVAIVSAGALAWLAWLILEQDKTAARQRRLDQAADAATAIMQSGLAELEHRLTPNPTDATLPAGVTMLNVDRGTITVSPNGSLLYFPEVTANAEYPSTLFADAEHAEFIDKALSKAARLYANFATNPSAAVRAGALTKLAAVYRKSGDAAAALETYDRLARISGANVAGLPAGLIARSGRASLFEEVHLDSDLRKEAASLRDDLLQGRWALTKSQYDSYSAEAKKWLADAWRESPGEFDAITRAEGAARLWENRRDAGAVKRLLIDTGPASALVIWAGASETFKAIIAGPSYLASLCREAVPDTKLRCTLGNPEGRIVVGDQPPARFTVTRTAAAAKLPWSLQVFPVSEDAALAQSPQRPLLLSVFAVLIVVWSSGAYFIVRSISREMRVTRLQSDFVAAVSHEFRSPLSSLRQISEMLAEDRLPSETARRESYGILARESERLHRLVEDLLDFGRFDAGAAVYNFERVEIRVFLQTLIAEFQERVAASGYRIELQLPDADAYVRADAEALSLAVVNLLDNAVKYSPDCRTVWVDADVDPRRVSISVRDRGLGIPLHEQRDIFERFVRGAESKALRIKGTGIGLAMVRHIIQAHRGEIRVASEPGEGSRFTMLLHTIGGAS
jgi:signal transduction histidine kinase